MSATPDQITALYQSILGRNPDPGGLEFWSGSGLDPKDIEKRLRDERDTEGSAENALFAKRQAVIKDINGLAKDNKIAIADILAYANDRKMPLNELSDLVSVAIPSLTLDSLEFERDRQSLATLADKSGAVDLAEAVKNAASNSISNQNLAKFFGKTPEEFASYVSTNARYLADKKVFDSIAPDIVATLTGASESVLNKAKTDSLVFSDLSAKIGDKGQISIADALGVGQKYGLTDAQLAPYIGLNESDITKYRKDATVQQKIAEAQSTDNTLTLDEILGIQTDTGMSLKDFVDQYFAGTADTKSNLENRLAYRSSLSPALKASQDEIAAMADPKTGSIDIGKLYEYALANKLSASDIAPMVGLQPDGLQASFNDVGINKRLQEASKDGLTFDEILNEVQASNVPIEDFVNKYLASEDKKSLISSLTAEAAFTPEERSLRQGFAGLGQPSMESALSFAAQNKLSDEDASRILGIDSDAISSYRRNQFITGGLNQAMGEDNQLDYNEIYQFAKQNNVNIDELINYLGEPDKRDSLKSDLNKYIEEVEADAKLSPTERLTQQLTEITGGGSKSGVWDKNNGWDHHLQKMVNYLDGYGIKDLRQIGTRIETRDVPASSVVAPGDDFRAVEGDMATNFVVYYDKVTGKELQAIPQSDNNGMWRFGSEGQGKGSTGYFLGPTQDGGAGLTSNWQEKYGTQEFALPLMFVAAIAAPYLLPEVIGTATGMTAAEAASLGLSANSGLAGMLVEAGMSIPAAQSAATVIAKGVYQGIVSEAAGGDFNKGFIAGGVAPWVAQYATNWAADNLPRGTNPAVARSVGLAVGQLMANGEIDPRQLAANALAPQVMDKIVKASDGALTANQAKLLFTTLATGGANITAMASNPLAVLNFVQQNKGLFDEVLNNKPISEIGKALNISALDDTQQKFFAENGSLQYPGSRYEGVEFPEVAGELVPGIQQVNSDGSISVGRDKETGLEVRLDPETNELYTTQNVWNDANSQVLMYSSRYKPYDPLDITKDVPSGLITQAKEIKAQTALGLSQILSPSTSLASNASQAGPASGQNASANVSATAQPGSVQAGSNVSTAQVLSVNTQTGQVLATDASGKPILLGNAGGTQGGTVKPGQNVSYETNTGNILSVTAGATADGSQVIQGTPGIAGGTQLGTLSQNGILSDTSGKTTVPGGISSGTGTVTTGTLNTSTGIPITTGGTQDTIKAVDDKPKPPVPQDTITTQDTVTGSQTTVTGGQTTVPGGQTTVPGGQTTVPSGQQGFDLFFPVSGQQTTDYIDYGQPMVGAPVLPEYYGPMYPNYLRPTELGPFGLQAILGALNATQQGNGGNQSQQNAQAGTQAKA